MTEINLPLSADNRFFIEALSSDSYENLVFETFLPADLLLTFFFRYPRLCAHDVTGDDATNGMSLDFTNSHPLYGWFMLLAIGGFAALNGYREYCKQKKAQRNASYQYIHSKLNEQSEWMDEASALAVQPQDMETLKVVWLEKYLQKIHQTDPELQAKYEKIEIKHSDNGEPQLSFKLREALPVVAPEAADNNQKTSWFRRNVINKFLSPLWETLGISSFAYWILWMGSGVIRGEFDVGVGGLDPAIGFGVPFAIGGVYMALKSYHWFKQYRAEAARANSTQENVPTPKELAETQQQACRLLRRAILDKQFNGVTKSLKRELGNSYHKPVKVHAGKYAESLDLRINQLGRNAKTKAATAFVSKTASAYVGVQYGAWIVTDVLAKVANVASAIPIVNTVCGWAFMAGSLAYGIYKGVKTYSAVKAQKRALASRVSDTQQQAESLETVYKQKLAAIDTKQKLLKSLGGNAKLPKTVDFKESQFYSDVTRKGESVWTRIKKGAVRALSFFNGITAGAFIARAFCVKGTAVFLPFAAAALSNPITIGIVAGVGVAYGLFKLYEYHQARKEERALNLLKEYTDRIDCLEREVEIADICLQVLDKRVRDMPAAQNTVVASAPEPQQSQQPRAALSKPLFHSPRTPVPSVRDCEPVSRSTMLSVA
jgi:hypothetical protein